MKNDMLKMKDELRDPRMKRVEERLSHYDADALKEIYWLVSRGILDNMDFCAVRDAGTDRDLIPQIEAAVGQAVTFDRDRVMDAEAMALFKRLESFSGMSGERRDAAAADGMRRLIAQVLGSDTLFKGFCLTFAGEDRLLEQLSEALGCTEQLDRVNADGTFKRRSGYIARLKDEARAAVHLYGVLPVNTFADLVRFYEIPEDSGDTDTLIGAPRYLCGPLLLHWLDRAVPEVLVTMDGLMVSDYFKTDYAAEHHALEQFLRSCGEAPDADALEAFFERMSGTSSFRRLYKFSCERPVSRLSKTEFLRFARGGDFEMFLEEDAADGDGTAVSWKLLPKHCTAPGMTGEEI